MRRPSTSSALAAVAAALWPERAAALLARGPDPAAAEQAAALATLPRAQRLAALAAALVPPHPSEEVVRAAAAEERPAVAALIRALGASGTCEPVAGASTVAPLLRRIAWERVTVRPGGWATDRDNVEG